MSDPSWRPRWGWACGTVSPPLLTCLQLVSPPPLHHGPSPSPGAGRPLRQVARREQVLGLGDGLSRTSTFIFPLSLPRILPVTPVGPCLPGHRSSRPYTIFELEQVRQQSRKYGPRSPAQGRGAGLLLTAGGQGDQQATSDLAPSSSGAGRGRRKRENSESPAFSPRRRSLLTS